MMIFEEKWWSITPETTPLACPDFKCVLRRRYWYESVCEKLLFWFTKGPCAWVQQKESQFLALGEYRLTIRARPSGPADAICFLLFWLGRASLDLTAPDFARVSVQ